MHDAPAVGDRFDVAVVGGGLAGLTAATTAARAGATVTLFEARDELGGRARTERVDGFSFNQGAHALYRAGAGLPVLRELGVRPTGKTPKQGGFRWVQRGTIMPLTRLSAIGGVAGLRVGTKMIKASTARKADGLSMAAWLDENVSEHVRPFAEMLVRTTTYGIDHVHQDAGETLDQVRRGSRNVLYLDGGWSTLVDGLKAAARRAGVVLSHERITAVEQCSGVGLTLGTGATCEAGAVVIAAGGASHADRLLGGGSARVAGWATDARPIRALALDVALPRSAISHTPAYGLGEPTYFVDHVRSAKVGPDGSALVQCLWYEPDLAPEVDHRAQLEASLDLLHPGWRDKVIETKFSRRLVVAHDRPQPGHTGGERPSVSVDDTPNVFVAGDWITADGMLADAALGSGRTAGQLAATAGASRSRPARLR